MFNKKKRPPLEKWHTSDTTKIRAHSKQLIGLGIEKRRVIITIIKTEVDIQCWTEQGIRGVRKTIISWGEAKLIERKQFDTSYTFLITLVSGLNLTYKLIYKHIIQYNYGQYLYATTSVQSFLILSIYVINTCEVLISQYLNNKLYNIYIHYYSYIHVNAKAFSLKCVFTHRL